MASALICGSPVGGGAGAALPGHGLALDSGAAGLAGGLGGGAAAASGPVRTGSSAISIRRVFWRPSGVSLVAIGRGFAWGIGNRWAESVL